jgi:hypothetical protein
MAMMVAPLVDGLESYTTINICILATAEAAATQAAQ